MCGVFGLEMENYQGDLNDIVRASTAAGPMAAMGCASDTVPVPPPPPADASSTCSWTRQFGSDPLNFSLELDDHNDFGDPFSTIRDPLLHHQLNIATAAVGSSSTYFSTHSSADHHHHHHHMIDSSSIEGDNTSSSFSAGGGAINNNMVDQIFREDDMRSPCSIFSRIRISPTTSSTNLQPPAVSPYTDSPLMASVSSPRGGGGGGGIKAAAVLPSDMIDNAGPLQISSPRNLGIKRRLG